MVSASLGDTAAPTRSHGVCGGRFCVRTVQTGWPARPETAPVRPLTHEHPEDVGSDAWWGGLDLLTTVAVGPGHAPSHLSLRQRKRVVSLKRHRDLCDRRDAPREAPRPSQQRENPNGTSRNFSEWGRALVSLGISVTESLGGFLSRQHTPTPGGAPALVTKGTVRTCLREVGGHPQMLLTLRDALAPPGTASWVAFASCPPTASGQGPHTMALPYVQRSLLPPLLSVPAFQDDVRTGSPRDTAAKKENLLLSVPHRGR